MSVHSEQATLTGSQRVIVDKTCSFTRYWPPFDCLRMDKRLEVRPMICADARFLPFADGCVDDFYCDPPHFIGEEVREIEIERFERGGLNDTERLRPYTLRYGVWPSKSHWLKFLVLVNGEFARCLKPEGRLHWKIACSDRGDKMIQRRHMSLLTNFEVEREDVRASGRATSSSLTYFITMRKRELLGCQSRGVP